MQEKPGLSNQPDISRDESKLEAFRSDTSTSFLNRLFGMKWLIILGIVIFCSLLSVIILAIWYKNSFAMSVRDMSDEEFAQLLLPKGYFHRMKETAKFIKTRPREWVVREHLDDYPPSFDWREKGVITPVKAQKIPKAGYCGSWAFACAATVESAHAIKYGVQELKSLSTQQLLDCELNDDECSGGEPEKAFKYIYEHGLTTWESYPYIAEDWHNNICKLHGNDTEKTSFEVAYFLPPDELSIIDWLVHFGPVNVAINVPPDMKNYTGGIYKPSDYDCIFKLIGTHALNIVGYGKSEEGEKYWIIKNSWGTDWGIENGYIHFARGVDTCGVEDKPIGLLG